MDSESPTLIGVGVSDPKLDASNPDWESFEQHSEAPARDIAAELDPEYELGAALGQGGFGTVFRAKQRASGLDVAVKVLRIQPGWDSRFVRSYIARFEREAELCAGLDHPNIVRLLDKGQTSGGFCYAVYELVPGHTLRARLAHEGRLSPVRAGEVMGQVLAALACAQEKGVVHRDLKPDNIMLHDRDGQLSVKVLDFGIGTVTLEARGRDFQSLTLTRETIGTPSYSAPEQLRGEAPTTKTDLYAWGLVFLECLTGRPTIRGSTLAAIYHQHLSSEEIPLPPSLAGHPVSEFLRRVLRKRPDQRAGDAAALLQEFRQLRLNDLVGELGHTTAATARLRPPSGQWQATELAQPAALRQLTVLACNLMVIPSPESALELEVLDAIHADQMGLCRDIVSRYGGVVVASVCDQLVTCFGHPVASDTDARRAARTALELAQDVRQRSTRLRASHAVTLEFRVGLHTGTVLSKELQHPDGITPSIAMRLCSLAPANTILVTEATRRMLEHRVEFEAAHRVQVNGVAAPTPTFLLVAERHAEALSFRPGQPSAADFVGRSAELSVLDRLWAEAVTGSARTALVSGEPGIGKSRLVREFLQKVRERGEICYECRCLAEHQNAALSPIIDLLRQELGLRDARSAEEASRILLRKLQQFGVRLDFMLPIFCSWLSVPCPPSFAPPPLAPYRQRELLLKTVVEILPQIGEHRPFVLVVEDLHWADVTTLDLLQQLGNTAAPTHALVLLTARQEFRPPDAFELQDLPIERLGAAASLELIRSLLGDASLSDGELSTIIQRTDGIPLFIEELTRMLMDDRLAPRDGATTPGRAAAIPITLRDSLNERLDRLGPARDTAQLAAALGREFERSVLISASARDEAAIASDLEKLLSANIVYQRRQVGASGYVFRHALIRDAAYDSMPSHIRRAAHARIASVLETEFTDLTPAGRAELARHHAAAEAFEPAVRYGIQAAEAALERSGNAEALAQGKEVTAWLDRLPADARVELELGINGVMAQALMGLYGWASPRVREQAERSRALLPLSTASHHTAATLFALFMHYHVASARRECRGVVSELRAHAEAANDRALRAVAATAQGVCHHAEGRFTDAADWLERALELYDPERDRDQAAIYGLDCRAWASAQLALVEWNSGKTRRAFEHAADAIAWSRRINHVPSLGIALLYISQIHQFEGDKASVLRTTGELLEVCGAYGLPAFEGYAATIRAWAEGDSDSVRAIIGVLTRMNCNLILTYYGSYLADIEAENGRYDQAVAEIEHCLALAEELDEHCFEPELHRRWASYELLRQNPRKSLVRSSLLRSTELAREFGMLRLEAMANLDLRRSFGASAELEARLRDIVAVRPELESLVSSFQTALVHSPVQHEASLPH